MADVDIVEVVAERPLVFNVVDDKSQVWWNPERLDRREIAANYHGAGEPLGDYVGKG
jgi:hypothetical protein